MFRGVNEIKPERGAGLPAHLAQLLRQHQSVFSFTLPDPWEEEAGAQVRTVSGPSQVGKPSMGSFPRPPRRRS